MNSAQHNIIEVTAGQKAIIDGVSQYSSTFTFGTVEDCTEKANIAASRWGWEQDSIENAVAKAKQNGHNIAWASQDATVLSKSTAFHAKQDAERAAALRLALGDLVRLRRRVYSIEPAANGNVHLKLVAE